ncbi:MAG: copper chaperone PCu(A)C [Gammaproteobacteria bacterium]
MQKPIFVVLVLTGVVCLCGCALGGAASQKSRAIDVGTVDTEGGAVLTVEHAWVRVMPPNSTSTAVYFDLTNHSAHSVAVVGVEADWATGAAFHQTIRAAGVARMQPVNEVLIPAGDTFRFQPGGQHIMMMGLREPLRQHDRKAFTLRYCWVFTPGGAASGSEAEQGGAPRVSALDELEVLAPVRRQP